MLKNPLYFNKPKTAIANGNLIVQDGDVQKEISIGEILKVTIQPVLWFWIFYRMNIIISIKDEEITLNNLNKIEAYELVDEIQKENQKASIEKMPMFISATTINGIPLPADSVLPKWISFLFIGMAVLVLIVILLLNRP